MLAERTASRNVFVLFYFIYFNDAAGRALAFYAVPRYLGLLGLVMVRVSIQALKRGQENSTIGCRVYGFKKVRGVG
jgi:hypothetical protein